MPGVVPVGQDSEVQCGDDLVRVGLGRMDDFAFSCLFRKEISSSMIDVVLPGLIMSGRVWNALRARMLRPLNQVVIII